MSVIIEVPADQGTDFSIYVNLHMFHPDIIFNQICRIGGITGWGCVGSGITLYQEVNTRTTVVENKKVCFPILIQIGCFQVLNAGLEFIELQRLKTIVIS